MTITRFANRLPAETRVPRVFTRHDALCTIHARLPQALQLLLESEVPSGAGLDPRNIAELITSLSAPMATSAEHFDLYRLDPPMSPTSVYALMEAATVFRKTADNVAAGAYALPESVAATGKTGVDALAKHFREVAEATDNLVEQLKRIDGAGAPRS